MAGKRPTQAGMTLIELLIAVAIGAIVLAALNSVVSLGLQAQASGRQANELVFQARFALERMVDRARSVAPKLLTTPAAANSTGDWFAPAGCVGAACVMFCYNAGKQQLIETTTTDTACVGTTAIASNVTLFFAQSAGCVGAACVMFCRNASNQLIKTTTTDTNCTGTTVIASNVTWFFAQPSGAGPVDKPVGVLFLLLTQSAAAQPVWLTTSVRLGGGTL